MAKTLRVGMIGHGFMGKAHSNAWRQAPFFFPLKAKLELHTICGCNPAGVQAARAQLGWQYAATDWREVIESPLIDVVDITTPNDSHAEIAIAAARAGKHVLCEKPLALNVQEAEAMLAAAQKAKVVHMVCHNYRRVPAIAQAIHRKVKVAKGRATAPNPNPEPMPAQKLGKVTVDDATLLIGRFGNGALANLEATRYAPGRKNHMTFEINGFKGSFCFNSEDMNRLKFCDRTSLPDRQGFRDILITQPGGVHPYIGQWWRAGHLLGYEHTFVHTVADFVNACAEGKPVHPTFEDGLMNQRVLTALEESVKTRGWVKL